MPAADSRRSAPDDLRVMSRQVIKDVTVDAKVFKELDLAVPSELADGGLFNGPRESLVFASRCHVDVLPDCKAFDVSEGVVLEAALICPSLGDSGQFVVPLDLHHVGGLRLPSGWATFFLTHGNPRPQLIMRIQQSRFLGFGEASTDNFVASIGDSLQVIY